MDIARLHREACRVRQAIEQAPHAEENSHWHRQFESKVLHKANFKVVSGPGVYDVLRFYARISRTLATGAET